MLLVRRLRRRLTVSNGRSNFERHEASADANNQQTTRDATHEASTKTLSNYERGSDFTIHELPAEIPISQPDSSSCRPSSGHEDLAHLASDFAGISVQNSDLEEPDAADNVPAHSDDLQIPPWEVQIQQYQKQLIRHVSVMLSFYERSPFPCWSGHS